MSRTIDRVLAMALVLESTMDFNQEQWKKDILEKWDESRKLPRKKKKRERKSLLIEWSVACWSPYDEMGNFKC